MAKIEDLMRNCLKAMEKGKSTDAADYFSENGVWITPFGKFVGKEQIKKFFELAEQPNVVDCRRSGKRYYCI